MTESSKHEQLISVNNTLWDIQEKLDILKRDILTRRCDIFDSIYSRNVFYRNLSFLDSVANLINQPLETLTKGLDRDKLLDVDDIYIDNLRSEIKRLLDVWIYPSKGITETLIKEILTRFLNKFIFVEYDTAFDNDSYYYQTGVLTKFEINDHNIELTLQRLRDKKEIYTVEEYLPGLLKDMVITEFDNTHIRVEDSTQETTMFFDISEVEKDYGTNWNMDDYLRVKSEKDGE